MRTSEILAPLFFAATALAQGPPEGIAPSTAPPSGCQPNASGNFTIGTLKVGHSNSKRETAREVCVHPLSAIHHTTTTTTTTHTNTPPGRRLRPRLLPHQRHPPRPRRPHRLRRRKPPIPIRRPAPGRRHLHGRLRRVLQRLARHRRLHALVAVLVRPLLQPVRRVDRRPVRGDPHPGHVSREASFQQRRYELRGGCVEQCACGHGAEQLGDDYGRG
jgi:hypothetical protein